MADGGTENPPCNRKGRAGNPPPKGARASALPDSGNLGSEQRLKNPNAPQDWAGALVR